MVSAQIRWISAAGCTKPKTSAKKKIPRKRESTLMWGIRLKSIRGRGGYIRDVRFEDIVIEDASQEAVQISMFYPYSTVEPESQIPPEFSRIYLKGISGSCRKLAWNMTGLPDSKIRDIALSDISLSAPESMVYDNVERMEMSNVRF